MTTPTDPLRNLGRRSALAVAERRAVGDHDAEVAAVAHRAGRPRRRQIAALAVAMLIVLPLAVSRLATPSRDIRFSPPPAPASWVEVGRDVFNGRGAGAISGVAVAAENIVAVGLEPDPEVGARTRPAAWTSTDGRTWEHHFVSDKGSLYRDAGLLMQDVAAVALGDQEWLVAVGYANFEPRTEPVVWLSYDEGVTWELRRVAGTGVMTSVTVTPSGLLAVGYDGAGPAAWSSFNGEDWSPMQVERRGEMFPGSQLLDVTAAGDRAVAVGRYGLDESGFWLSEAGAAWQLFGAPELPDARLEISSVTAEADGGFLAAGPLALSGEGSDGAVLESADGRAWERTSTPVPAGTPGEQALAAVVTVNGERLAVGHDRGRAAIWTSAGGDWRRAFTDEAAPEGVVSQADAIVATPAGLLVTGIATVEGGAQEARMWLRPGTAAPPAPPVEIIDQPIGTFGGSTPLGPLTYSGITITAGGFESGVITARDARTGAEVWTYDLFENAFLGPVSGSTLLAASQYGQVVALDVESGAERWSLSLDVVESAGHATVEDGVVYLPTSYPVEGDTAAPRVYAVDLESGAVLWRRSLEPGTDLQWAPPVVTGDLVLVADTLSHPRSAETSWLHALDRVTGKRVWQFDLETRRQGFFDHPPLVRDGTVFVTGAWGPLFAVDGATGQQRWRRPAGEQPRALRLAGDALIVELNGRERRLDIEDGTLVD